VYTDTQHVHTRTHSVRQDERSYCYVPCDSTAEGGSHTHLSGGVGRQGEVQLQILTSEKCGLEGGLKQLHAQQQGGGGGGGSGDGQLVVCHDQQQGGGINDGGGRVKGVQDFEGQQGEGSEGGVFSHQYSNLHRDGGLDKKGCEERQGEGSSGGPLHSHRDKGMHRKGAIVLGAPKGTLRLHDNQEGAEFVHVECAGMQQQQRQQGQGQGHFARLRKRTNWRFYWTWAKRILLVRALMCLME
jgi:hypothetical protein